MAVAIITDSSVGGVESGWWTCVRAWDEERGEEDDVLDKWGAPESEVVGKRRSENGGL